MVCVAGRLGEVGNTSTSTDNFVAVMSRGNFTGTHLAGEKMSIWKRGGKLTETVNAGTKGGNQVTAMVTAHKDVIGPITSSGNVTLETFGKW